MYKTRNQFKKKIENQLLQNSSIHLQKNDINKIQIKILKGHEEKTIEKI